MSAEYFVGRRSSTLDLDQFEYSDALFEATRFDGQEIRDIRFKHCTFANNSFKSTKLINCEFENVVFLSGYFRDSVVINTEFRGSRFIDCDFTRVDLRYSRLKFYNRFSRSYIPFNRIQECLPEEGNLRKELCDALAREAVAVGEYRDADLFRAEAIRGEKRFLKAVIWQSAPYYKAKYDNVDRLRAVGRYVRFRFFDLLWGQRRSHRVILRNWLALGIVFAILMATSWRGSLGGDVSIEDAAIYGFLAVFPVQPLESYSISGTVVSFWVLAARFLALIFSGLFVALLFARLYEGRR